MMRIAIASGKGGTGKTTLAVNLALSLHPEHPVQLLDCDVEEPNAHLFLTPDLSERRAVSKLVPTIDETLCRRCGACAEACEFSAMALLGDRMLVYDALCHGCGRCSLVCPAEAIAERPHTLGVVETGSTHGFPFAHGVLNVGETMATPIIHVLKEAIDPDRLAILDSPPGTGCPTIAALHGVDVALLVTEPTPFGLHDLKAAVGVARTLEVPVAVAINRCDLGDSRVEEYCQEEEIPIVLTIPFDRAIAETYAQGIPLVSASPAWRARFQQLYERLEELLT